MSLAFKIFSVNDIEKCQELINKMRLIGREIIKQNKCTEEEFERIRINKMIKKGGFEKGYILLETDLINKESNKMLFNERMSMRYIPIVNYDFFTKTRVDVEILKMTQLLIRSTFSIYTRDIKWIVKNKKICSFLNEDIDIHITKKIIDTKIIFGIEFRKNNYKQLVLDFI